MKLLRKMILKLGWYVTQRRNQRVLLRLCNLPAEGNARLTQDENDLLKLVLEKTKPSQLITRKGKTVCMLKSVEDIGLWDMLEARRSEDSLERIKAWTDGNYMPKTIYDAVRADKYIIEQMQTADALESHIFSGMNKGGNDTFTGDETIRQAKNLLSIVQITSELFACSFEDAKNINYTDAMLAVAKRNDEIEKQKRDNKKNNR